MKCVMGKFDLFFLCDDVLLNCKRVFIRMLRNEENYKQLWNLMVLDRCFAWRES